MNFTNMEDSPRLIWLLLLVLFQPVFTGAACSITRTTERENPDYDDDYIDYKYYIQCTLTSLQMNVPLTMYIHEYVHDATYALSIDFSSSTINTVPVGVFQAFSAVVLLKMDNVYINRIMPGALRGLAQLEELNLSHNNISEIQDGTFDGLPQLKKLNMAGNKLTTLKSLKGLKNLKWLDVDRNNIVTIDDGAFEDTVKLENLNLNRNKLVKFNAIVFSTMPQLLTVDLSNNVLRSVSCSELSGRVTLHLNQITSLVNCSSHISYLDVRYNKLTSLPAMLFSESPSKISLDLAHNDISSVHVDAFLELRHLATLTMNNNRITSIPVGTFRHLGEVTTLDISFNNLTHLEYGLFGGLTSLKVLHVSDNNIAMLESKVLFPLISLTRLNLDGNLLRTFDVDTMVSHLTTLESISLDRNQIQCDWLTNCIYVLTLRNITVVTGDSFTGKNVHGIYCVSEKLQRISTPPTEVIVRVTQLLLPTTKPPIRRKSVAPIQIPSTMVFSFSKAPELVEVSTEDAIHTQTTRDHNDHAVGDCNTAEASRTDDEKINVLLKVNSSIHSLLVFATVAVIILIITNMLINLYFTKRNNIKNDRKSVSSCAVELLSVTN